MINSVLVKIQLRQLVRVLGCLLALLRDVVRLAKVHDDADAAIERNEEACLLKRAQSVRRGADAALDPLRRGDEALIVCRHTKLQVERLRLEGELCKRIAPHHFFRKTPLRRNRYL